MPTNYSYNVPPSGMGGGYQQPMGMGGYQQQSYQGGYQSNLYQNQQQGYNVPSYINPTYTRIGQGYGNKP
jgi:hypothetical protein